MEGSHEHGHEHGHEHIHRHIHEHAHGGEVHTHEHEHVHSHEHTHSHSHEHEHARRLPPVTLTNIPALTVPTSMSILVTRPKSTSMFTRKRREKS